MDETGITLWFLCTLNLGRSHFARADRGRRLVPRAGSRSAVDFEGPKAIVPCVAPAEKCRECGQHIAIQFFQALGGKPCSHKDENPYLGSHFQMNRI